MLAEQLQTNSDYERERENISKAYFDDGQGFYYADYQLRIRYGLPLCDEHEQAIKAEHNKIMNNDNWRI